jgi:hypothetical protein
VHPEALPAFLGSFDVADLGDEPAGDVDDQVGAAREGTLVAGLGEQFADGLRSWLTPLRLYAHGFPRPRPMPR